MKNIILSILLFFSISFALSDVDKKVDEMLLKAWQYYERGNYFMMLEQAQKTLKYSLKYNNPKGIAESYYYIGIAYFMMGDIDKALKYANKAIEYSKDKPNYKWKAYAHTLLAEIMLYLKKYDEALKHYRVVLKLSQENNNKKMIPITLLDIGNVYFYKKDYNKALKYYLEALQKIKNIKIRPYYKALVNYNIAMAYFKLKDYKNAAKYFKVAAEIYKRIGNIKASVESSYFLAKSLMKSGDKDGALKVLKEFKPLAKKVFFRYKFEKLEKEIKKGQ